MADANVTATAARLRYDMKTVCRSAIALKEQIDSVLNLIDAMGVVYDGTNPDVTQDNDAVQIVAAIRQAQTLINTLKPVVVRGADLGNILPVPAN